MPSFLHNIYFGWKSEGIVELIKDKYSQMSPGDNYSILVNDSISYFGQYLGSYLLVATLFIVGYYAIIQGALERIKHEKFLSLSESLFSGMRLAIPRGLFVFVFMSVIGILSYTLFPPMILIFVLTLIIPIVHTAEHKKFFTSIKNSMLLKYAVKSEQLGPWRAFFALSGIIGFYYIISLLLGQLFQNADILEKFLPQAIWGESFLIFPFSFLYFLKILVISILYTFIMSTLPVISTRFYYEVRNRVSQKV